MFKIPRVRSLEMMRIGCCKCKCPITAKFLFRVYKNNERTCCTKYRGIISRLALSTGNIKALENQHLSLPMLYKIQNQIC